MKLFNESFLYAMVKFWSAVFSRLPYRFNLAFARMMGLFMSFFMKRKMALIEGNLKTAFAGQLSHQEISSISKQVFQNFVSNFMDLLCLPKIKAQGIEKTITVEGKENVDQAIALGKGCILLAIHSGNWELASVVASTLGYPYNVVANEQKKAPKLNELLNDYRRLAGAKVIPPGSATREIIRVLQANEIVTLVLDQGGKEGVAVDFFGKTASMSTGAIRLGLKYQTPVCPVWTERQKNGTHVLRILPPLKLENTEDVERDVNVNAQKAVKIFEDLLRVHPEEFMWFYKIYKYTSQADTLILDDGKTGHLRQSQAVCEIIKTLLGRANKQMRTKTVSIMFKGAGHQKLFAVYCLFAQIFSFLRKEEALKIFLKEDCYKALSAIQPDYIVSCGSQTASISFILSRSTAVKSIHILKPNLVWSRWFSLIILPEHDRPAGEVSKRFVFTKTALNLITPEYLRQQQERLLLRYSHLQNNVRSKIGLLLGGNTKGVVFDVTSIRQLIRQLKDAAEHFNMDLLVTTSRRTPTEVDQMITKELRNFNRCSLLIIPNEANIPEAVGGILALSDILFVSGESISMVSEALSSNKKTIVFSPTGNYSEGSSSNKYDRFVLDLNQQGYLLASSIKDISNTLTQLMSKKISVKNIDDRIKVLQAIEGVL